MPTIISDAAVFRAFSALDGFPSAALAVSGGPDSMALMAIARRWAAAKDRDLSTLVVITVDHRLRSESQSDAEFVAKWAAHFGLQYAMVTWTGDKPKTGVQAAARIARYRLLSDFCRARSIPVIATAHTEDDQAETLLMRLRRGSGLDGLAAIQAVSVLDSVTLLRPLLGFSKARLTAYLRSNGIPFIHDPSNDNASFERVRLRSSMKAAAKVGLTTPALALSAARLARSRNALSHITQSFLDENFQIQSMGQGEMVWNTFTALPEDIGLRALGLAIALIGGKEEPPRLAKTETVLAKLKTQSRRETLGGCLLIRASGTLCFYREPGRLKQCALSLSPDESVIWDGRFLLRQSATVSSLTTVQPLGPEGWFLCRECEDRKGGAADRLAAITTPALWTKTELLCAPLVGFINTKITQFSTPPLTAAMLPRLARFARPSLGGQASELGKDTSVPYL